MDSQIEEGPPPAKRARRTTAIVIGTGRANLGQSQEEKRLMHRVEMAYANVGKAQTEMTAANLALA
jgi:hypothetical protein